jgi:predicted RNA-binding Zn-ribbon protein involved in translation (DUF1610 family)
VSDLETSKNRRNSARQPLPGWKLQWRLHFALRPGKSTSELQGYHKDSAFPACPSCGSPNVMLAAHRRGQSFLCLERDCGFEGATEVEGSSRIKWRKARVRIYVYMVALLVLLLVLLLTGHFGLLAG